jgi:anhydro-N-acetylmuramic acid kinase
VLAPLDLRTTRYLPTTDPLVPADEADTQNVAPTELCAWRGRRVAGQVRDENAARLDGVAGHAGIFSTADEVARFGQAFLSCDLLTPVTIAEMTLLQAQDGNIRRGLGFALWSPDPEASSNPFGPGAFGHTGFTGTSLWIDPERSLVVAALTNRILWTSRWRHTGVPGGAAPGDRGGGGSVIVIGLMSGTSADGIDAAAVSLSGSPPSLQWRLLSHVHRPYASALRAEILACCLPQTGDAARLCRLGFELGRAYADVALLAAETAGLPSGRIDLIASHGQTVWHDPAVCTLQIGEAAVIAERTGITTISNFRARDVAAGGHGAPLVAYADRLLFTHPTLARACQNLGGIANVTYLPPARDSGEPGVGLAFDTGPGNMLIDDAAARATRGAWTYDVDGALAAAGRVDAELLAELLSHPYFLLPPPKTTGRELFGAQMGAHIWEQGMRRSLRDEDVVATLTALTARSIARAYQDFLPAFPRQVIVSGGGARNATLMAMLRHALAEAHPEQPPRVLTSDELGLPVEAKRRSLSPCWPTRRGMAAPATIRRRPVLGALWCLETSVQAGSGRLPILFRA